MKFKSLTLLLSLALFSQNCFSCDFANDIRVNQDGTYTYSKECHIEVGKRIKKLTLIEAQVVELERTIELKDLALSKEKQRADAWMDTSFQINDKLQKYDAISSKSNAVYFGLGLATAILSVWAAGQLVR